LKILPGRRTLSALQPRGTNNRNLPYPATLAFEKGRVQRKHSVVHKSLTSTKGKTSRANVFLPTFILINSGSEDNVIAIDA
jgi:hypothetical protein